MLSSLNRGPVPLFAAGDSSSASHLQPKRDRQDMEVEESEGLDAAAEAADMRDDGEDSYEAAAMKTRKLPRNKSDSLVRRGLGDDGDGRRTKYSGAAGSCGAGCHYRNGLKPCKCLKPNDEDGASRNRSHKIPSPSFS